MHHGANFRLVLARATEFVVNWKKMFFRKLIGPLDQNFLTAANVKRRSRNSPVKTPHPRRFQIAMNLYLQRPQGYAVVRHFYRCVRRTGAVFIWLGDRGNRQRINEFRESIRVDGIRLHCLWMRERRQPVHQQRGGCQTGIVQEFSSCNHAGARSDSRYHANTTKARALVSGTCPCFMQICESLPLTTKGTKTRSPRSGHSGSAIGC